MILPIILFFFLNSVEADDWHSIGLAEHLKTEISLLYRDFIALVCPFCDQSLGFSCYI